MSIKINYTKKGYDVEFRNTIDPLFKARLNNGLRNRVGEEKWEKVKPWLEKLIEEFS